MHLAPIERPSVVQPERYAANPHRREKQLMACRKWQWVGGLRVANAHCRCRIGVGLWYNTAIMSGSGCSEIKSRAREALFAGQYLRYAAAYFLLALVASFTIVPLLGILSVGVAASGIMPFLQPGGQPEIGLFLDPEVMLPLLGSVLIFSLLVIYPIGFVAWGAGMDTDIITASVMALFSAINRMVKK